MNLNGFGYLFHLSLPVSRHRFSITLRCRDKVSKRLLAAAAAAAAATTADDGFSVCYFSLCTQFRVSVCALLDASPCVFVLYIILVRILGLTTSQAIRRYVYTHSIAHLLAQCGFLLTHEWKKSCVRQVFECVLFLIFFPLLLFEILLLSACWLRISTVKL